MRILIIIFIFFSYYSSLNANEIFNLIKIPNLEVFNLDSENKIKYLSLKKSFTIGATKNITCDKANESNLKIKYEIIKKNLDIYNYQFLKKNNVRFVVLCENLSISGIGTAGIPDIQKRTLILNINFNPKYFERVIHHEIFHIIQDSFKLIFNETTWSEFNDKSFKYAECSTCSNRLGLDLYDNTKGFLTEYSKSIPSEDMAEVYSFLMTDKINIENISKNDSILFKKIEYIKAGIDKIVNF